MSEISEFHVRGGEARLFPVLAETNRERRVASIFLAVLTQIPAFADDLFRTVGVRIGKRSKIEAYIEVKLKNEPKGAYRPDGLVVVRNGRSCWSALIEAKIGRSMLDPEQVIHYLELAKENGINAVITISNEFVSHPSHSPVKISKNSLRKVELFHWSWSMIATQSQVLQYQSVVDDAEQSYLLAQFVDFITHPDTGMQRFTQMGPNWRELVQSVVIDGKLQRGSPNVDEAVANWISEERDLCLHLSTHIGRNVSARIERKLANDPASRLARGVATMADAHRLSSYLKVPDCASDISVSADLARKTITVSMWLKAPTDRVSTKARVNWVLRMLKSDDERLHLRALWPGRAVATMKDVAVLRSDPGAIQAENAMLAPHSFEVVMVESTGRRFSGAKTFIEDVERITLDFYDLVGAHLKEWQPSPPKPVQGRNEAPGEHDGEIENLVDIELRSQSLPDNDSGS